MPAALDHLRALDKRILFITNNSTRSRRDVAAKFQQLGLGWVTERHVLNSAYAAADCLANRLHVPTSRKVRVGQDRFCVLVDHAQYSARLETD